MPASPPSRLARRDAPAASPSATTPDSGDAEPSSARLRPGPRPQPPEPDRPGRRWYRTPPALVGGGVLVVLLAGLVWVVVTAFLARSQLDQARAEVSALQSTITKGGAQASDIDARIATISAHARRAHHLTTGPAWAVTAQVPWLGRPAEVTRGLTKTADDLMRSSLAPLGRVADRVEGGGLRRGSDIDLSALTAVTPDVTSAAQGFGAARDALAQLPASTWLGAVDRARSEVSDQIGGLATSLGSAETALHVLPTMLGSSTPQRYFVAFQNNAEARGTGGLPGAFGIVTAVDGTVKFERFESDDVFLKPTRVDVDGEVNFGADQADYLAQYGYDLPFGDYRESNESPNFPYAAQIWAAMWKKYSGEQVTGVVAVDPTALSYLLAATGPVKLTDGTVLSADTIVAITQKDVYAKFPGTDNDQIDRRKAFLLDVAAQTEKSLLAGSTDTAKLVKGASKAADERRLLVWSADPQVESTLADTAVGGVLPDSKQPFGMLVVLNVAGTKLDYYLDRRVTWTRSGCGDLRDVTVRITVTNRAPASGLPAYVTYRADDPPAGTPVGSNRWVLDWYGTSGGLLQSITVDGRAAASQVFQQRGHPVFRTLVETPPGGSHTVVLKLREPVGTDAPAFQSQPLIRPLVQTASDDNTC